ncbi:hypothetical protein D9611_003608 [Ephemerocybe angulata]|uniref:TEA domain-containing protein n=1 Tax=Ephemerocybe angulata TaxID=980116 RepID=A0A8H5B584_9AGAR|nr:hypothetical protein D9611_003608 [Tulosesus angulatus]
MQPRSGPTRSSSRLSLSRSSPSTYYSMRHPSPVEENFASPQLDNPRTQDVFQSIVKGRKSWKTLRGGEVVWPPELEAALIEGLENYIPDDSRETRLLGRFPLRNRFISDWIFEKTGKRRTAKQVGSRLQQLRDSCGGRKLLNLLAPKRPIPHRASSLSPEIPHRSGVYTDHTSRQRDTDSSSDRSSPSSPATPTESTGLQHLLYRGIASSTESPPNSIVYIDLLPTSSSSASKVFLDSSMPSSREDELMWAERGLDVVRISPQARYISNIDPTITFTSPSLITAASVFSVYLDDDLVHSEDSPLESSGLLTPNEDAYLYSTRLLPGYWGKLCHMSDLSRHTIVHRVVEERSAALPGSASKVLFSTMYRFSYSTPTMSLFTNAYDSGPTLLATPPHKNSALDVSFDSILAMSSPEGYYEPKLPQQAYYDMSPNWSTTNSVSSYQGSH